MSIRRSRWTAVAEIAVFLEGLPRAGAQDWNDKSGWVSWVALYKPETEHNPPFEGKEVESTGFSLGLFHG